MKLSKITVAAFSPTKGSLTGAQTVAAAISNPFTILDLTQPSVREGSYHFKPDELVILAAPVYAGRLPVLPKGEIFDSLQGDGTPAILLVSYGNRDFDDALLELYDLALAHGFRPVGAVACVAPHTFNGKVGANRPNGADRQELQAFAVQVAEKLAADQLTMQPPSGNRPYKKPMSMPFAPKGGSNCNSCGRCVKLCPTGAIDPNNPRKTDKAKCIACLACVKGCPQKTRTVKSVLYPAVSFALGKKLTPIQPNHLFL